MSGTRRHGRLSLGVVAAVVVLAALLPASAAAHSFLIRSTPQAGARLGSIPHTMTLYFSEPFVRGSERLSIRRTGGGPLTLASAQAAGSTIRQPLPPQLRGVFVVSWRVLSDDGHISLGEFAFAVGAGGALPTLTSGGGTSWADVAASWLFFIGLALGLGGLASERFVWGRERAVVARAPAASGLLLAGLASVWTLVLVAGAERGGGFTTGFSVSALGDALGTRPGTLTLTALAAVLAAAPFLPFRRIRAVAIIPLSAAVVATSLRGHSGTSNAWWAVTADVLHLAGAALWVGALTHLVLALARARERLHLFGAAVHGYSRLALPTVFVVLASGIVTAIPEFRDVGAVASSSYGRTLLIKAALIGIALLFALAARRRALPANPHPRWPLLRRLTGGESMALVGVLVAVAVLVNAAPPRSVAASALPQLGPPPLGPAVRLADLTGQLVVGIAATKREVQFMVVPPSDRPKESVKLSADAIEPGGRALDLFPRACGPECFTIRYALKPGRNVITAHVRSSVWRGGDARFVIPWPLAPERPALVRRVAAAMRSLRILRLTEAVTSGPGSGTPAGSYQLSGRQFMQTEVFGGGAVDVRVLGRTRGLTEFAFALPGSNIWYRMWIDRHYRLRREQIVDPGHLIRRTFSYGGQVTARSGAATTPAPPLSSGAPVAPANTFALAQEDGDLAVGLSITPIDQRLRLETTVLGPDGKGISDLSVSYVLAATGGARAGRTVLCGAGCYRALLPIAGRPESVRVRLSGGGRAASTLHFVLPSEWPPATATVLVRRATALFRSLKSVVIHEQIASDPSHVVRAVWTLAAPDRAAYRIAAGGAAVIIGGRRWDRSPAGRWQRSPQSPLVEPAPPWGTPPAHAWLLGSATVAGRPSWIVAFTNVSGPTWMTLSIDKATLRPVALQLITAAHFMHHRYSNFNAPVSIVPPTAPTRR